MRKSWPSKPLSGYLSCILFGLVFVGCPLAIGESASNDHSSAPEALVIVKKSLEAMGGEIRWERVGAAIAEVEISTQGEAVRKLTWSDDWSSGSNRYLRKSQENSSANSTVGTSTSHVLQAPNGKSISLPPSSDIVVLAVGYPAAALMLSLKRAACSFHMTSPSAFENPPIEANDLSIMEQCTDSRGGQTVQLRWSFSASSGMPTEVILPTRAISSPNVGWEQVKYSAFKVQDDLHSPSVIEIVRSNGYKTKFTVSSIEFHTSLPDQLFNLKP